MTRYDFSRASDFLELEARITPEELLDEIEDAMGEIDPSTPLWHTLLTIADFFEVVTPIEKGGKHEVA